MYNGDESSIHLIAPIIHNTINNFPPPVQDTRRNISQHEKDFRAWVAKWAVPRASFSFAERGAPPRCHPGTRTGVQDSLGAWPDNPHAGPVRLISGWAGTGKTTVAQTMAEFWAKQRRLAASFFFFRASEDDSLKTTDQFEETILYQLFKILDLSVPSHVSERSLSWDDIVEILTPALADRPPMIIIIDGLDECHNHFQQERLLESLLDSVDKLGPSIKLLISCRPELRLEKIFNDYADKLGPSYRITLGQAPGDNDDIRTFLQVSFDRICRDRRQDNAMSILDGQWPSKEQMDDLVDWASGQFVFAATAINFVDQEKEDPVEMLEMILARQTSSFSRIDALYLVILQKTQSEMEEEPGQTAKRKPEKKLEQEPEKGLEQQSGEISEEKAKSRQLTQKLLLHVNNQPSPSSTIAEFWFERAITVNIRVRLLRAVLDRPHGPDGPIRFRHKSFHDFLARPSARHSFSLAEMNPVSKFFFSLRIAVERASQSMDIRLLRSSQWLGFSLLYHEGHPPINRPYKEEARILHQEYTQNRPLFRGCACLQQLDYASLETDGLLHTLEAVRSCNQQDCVITSNILELCRMLEMSVSRFITQWKNQEELAPLSFLIFKFLLWFRVMLNSIFNDPLLVLVGTTPVLVYRRPELSVWARCLVLSSLFIHLVAWTDFNYLLILGVLQLAINGLANQLLRSYFGTKHDGSRIHPTVTAYALQTKTNESRPTRDTRFIHRLSRSFNFNPSR